MQAEKAKGEFSSIYKITCFCAIGRIIAVLFSLLWFQPRDPAMDEFFTSLSSLQVENGKIVMGLSDAEAIREAIVAPIDLETHYYSGLTIVVSTAELDGTRFIAFSGQQAGNNGNAGR